MAGWAATIDSQAQVSALCAWPDGYSAGVVDCVLALRLERAIEQARQAEAR